MDVSLWHVPCAWVVNVSSFFVKFDYYVTWTSVKETSIENDRYFSLFYEVSHCNSDFRNAIAGIFKCWADCSLLHRLELFNCVIPDYFVVVILCFDLHSLSLLSSHLFSGSCQRYLVYNGISHFLKVCYWDHLHIRRTEFCQLNSSKMLISINHILH